MKPITDHVIRKLSNHPLRDVADSLPATVENAPDSYLGVWFAAHLHLTETKSHYDDLLSLVQSACRDIYGKRKGAIPVAAAAMEYYLHVHSFRDLKLNTQLFDAMRKQVKKPEHIYRIIQGTEYDNAAFYSAVLGPVFENVAARAAPLKNDKERITFKVLNIAHDIERGALLDGAEIVKKLRAAVA